MEILLYHKQCWHFHSIKHLRFLDTIVNHQLQELHIVEQRHGKVPFAKDVKSLSNPAVFILYVLKVNDAPETL